jgi:hypothetical protein
VTAASRRLAVALLALAVAVPTCLRAQGQAQSRPLNPAAAKGDPIPLSAAAPAKAENPWSRFEIVSLGSFPIMLFYADFAFDLGRYIAKGFDVAYAPWPLKSIGAASLSDSERLVRIGATLGASLLVGAVDAYLHAKKASKAKRLRQAQESAGP